MTLIAISRSKYFRKCTPYLFLLFFWLFGLLIGFSLYLFCEPSTATLMRSVSFQPVSIVGFLIVIFFPLFLCSFSVFINSPVIYLIVCFLKIISFGFAFAAISMQFESASWLYRFLIMFSDHCVLVLLLTAYIRIFSYFRLVNKREFLFFWFLGLLIAAADYWVISPFLIGVF